MSSAGHEAGRYPLLALPQDTEVSVPERTRALTADDADLGLAVGAVQAAFDGDDDVTARPVGRRPG